MSSPQNLLHEYNNIQGAISTEAVKAAERVLLSYEQSASFIADNAQLLAIDANLTSNPILTQPKCASL